MAPTGDRPTRPPDTGARPSRGQLWALSGGGWVGTVGGAQDQGPAPTDELHGRLLQVPVGAAQVSQRLHEKLVVVAKVALHLGRGKRRVPRLPVTPLRPRPPASPAVPRPMTPPHPTSRWGLCQGTWDPALCHLSPARPPGGLPGPSHPPPSPASATDPGPVRAKRRQGGLLGSSAPGLEPSLSCRPRSLPWACAVDTRGVWLL